MNSGAGYDFVFGGVGDDWINGDQGPDTLYDSSKARKTPAG